MTGGITEGSGCDSELKSESSGESQELGKGRAVRGGGDVEGDMGRNDFLPKTQQVLRPEVMESSVDVGSWNRMGKLTRLLGAQ